MAIKFGFCAEKCDIHKNNDDGFDVSKPTTENAEYNPYGKENATNIFEIPNQDGSVRLTSIPSPYARMHIVNNAFFECAKAKRNREAVSAYYEKAVSHCLDIFELLYYSDQIDFDRNGIFIEKIDLVSSHEIKDGSSKKDKLLYEKEDDIFPYLQCLDVYRENYLESIAMKCKKMGRNFHYNFDFSSLYIIKLENEIIAATSPFTGFFTKDNCQSIELPVRNGTKTYLSEMYTEFDERDPEFQDFLFSLLYTTGLGEVYDWLFDYIKTSDKYENEQARLEKIIFTKDNRFKKFNFTGDLMKIMAKNSAKNGLYILPNNFNNSYLQYLLYLQEPISFSIQKEDYCDGIIEDRKFMDENKAWVSIDDFITDDLFVLDYKIDNSKYYTITTDKGGSKDNGLDCLLPLTERFFEFFHPSQINDLISIFEEYEYGCKAFKLELRLPTQNGSTVKMQKRFDYEKTEYPNGLVHELKESGFAFGIYPFIKAPEEFGNFYKILYYHRFANIDLKFIRINNFAITQVDENHITSKETHSIQNTDDAIPASLRYYSLDSCLYDSESEVDISFDLIKLKAKTDSKESFSAMIVPKLKTINPQGIARIAIDIGTSNTFLAYNKNIQGKLDISYFSTVINEKDGINVEFVLLGGNSSLKDKHSRDIHSELRIHQLCEFIPTRFEEKDSKNGYTFPIPTAINVRKSQKGNKFTPLIDANIPFSYYELGQRYINEELLDNIFSGSKFKWESKQQGIFHACRISFIDQLMFMLRSHLLTSGFNLKDCQIIWSYPISFHPNLKTLYDRIWKEVCCRYFKIKNAEKNTSNTQNDEENSGIIINTTESRTPVFDIISENDLDKFTLLLDIGGGSTDIIAHKDKKPQFITSFEFAGNDLYSQTSLLNKENIFYKIIEDAKGFKISSDSITKKIKPNPDTNNIPDLMNYAFSNFAYDIEHLFGESDEIILISLLHTSALIYQIAQISKIIEINNNKGKRPEMIFLSGNGSKLIMNYITDITEREKHIPILVNAIFNHVFNDGNDGKNDIDIKNAERPKEATARGALIGYDEIHSEYIGTNKVSFETIISLGDAKNIIRKLDSNKHELTEKDYLQVKTNVEEFLDMFYDDIYSNLRITSTVLKKRISREVLLGVFRKQCVNIEYPKDKDSLTECLFFNYIKKIINGLSQGFASGKIQL